DDKQPPPSTQSIRAQYLSLLNVGKAHYENREAEKAIESFSSAVKLLPVEPAGRLNLARAYLHARLIEKALAEAKEVLAIDRHSTPAHYLAGIAHLRLGQVRQAIAQLEETARRDPAEATVHFQLANAFKRDDQTQRYADELHTTIALNPNHWNAHYQLAQLALRARDSETAKRHLEQYERIFKSLPDVKKSPEVLEQCKYTVAEVPVEVHQPSEKPIDVRFVAKPIPLPGHFKVALPIALIDIDADGLQEVLVTDDAGEVRLMHNRSDTFELSDAPLATLPRGECASGEVADFDNDKLTDVFLFGSRTSMLLKQGEGHAFTDVTASAGLDGGGIRDAIWIDYDHDSDLDLLVVTRLERLQLWQNKGNGTFEDQTEPAGISPELLKITQVQATDFDGDEATDVVVVSVAGPAWLLHNDGLGIFSRRNADPPWPVAFSLIVEDFDNDLRRDLLVWGKGGVEVLLSSGGLQAILRAGVPAWQLKQIDYDNDGWLDVLAVTVPPTRPDIGLGLGLLRNVGAGGWQDVTAACGLSKVQVDGRTKVLVADFDGDGDSDVLYAEPPGRPVLLDNEGGNANRQLKIQLTGTKSNRSGIGTVVEIRSGGFRVSRTVTELPIEIGVGNLKHLDSVRTVWTNGVVKNDIGVKTPGTLKIEEPLVSTGSCPYLYAWDGQEFRFITDILGGAPLGLPMRRGRYVPADTYEYIRLGDQDTFPPRDGRYVVQITDELREILYLDYVRLAVVDHPPGTEVHETDKLEPPPFSKSELWVLKDRIDVVQATDNTGRDWTSELRALDGVRTKPPALRPPQLRGLAEEHSYTLDFGPLDVSRPWVLVLNGWLMWGEAGVAIAAGQNPDLPNPWPRLDAEVNGEWQAVDVTVGAPSGKPPQSVVVDLAGALPESTTRLRLTAAFEIYWDRAALFVREEAKRALTVTLAPVRAELYWRGFPRQTRPDPSGPVLPVTSDISLTPPWDTTPVGWCTRYGDILELLTEIDDRFVIFNGGDAATIEFAAALEPLPDGWKRSFFLISDGWDKDSDYNVLHGDTVEPLPFHGMDDQLYGRQPRPPATDDWIERYNTRWVGP
ncbi:MAG: FG-GAP-like repeat-containing protein, partial [Planctomycetota bacterium]|nr:FG-GAP-like repeat-containing protein [Planctomycetota bacterium]